MMEITRVNSAQTAMTVSLSIESPPFEKAYALHQVHRLFCYKSIIRAHFWFITPLYKPFLAHIHTPHIKVSEAFSKVFFCFIIV